MKSLRIILSSTFIVLSFLITPLLSVEAQGLGGLLGNGNSSGNGGLGNLLGGITDGGGLFGNNNSNGPSTNDIANFKTEILKTIENESFSTPNNCTASIMTNDWTDASKLGQYALSNSRIFIEDGAEKVGICLDFHNGKTLVQTTFEADGQKVTQNSKRGKISTQMYFKKIIFIDKSNVSRQLTYTEWKKLDTNKRDINFGDPKVLPSIDFEYDTYNEADGSIINKSSASLEELKLFAKLPGIITIIPGTTKVSTNIEYVKEERMRSGTLDASDIRRDSIETKFTLLRVNNSDVYDGRGVGLQPLEKGNVIGMVETDDKDELFKKLLNFALTFVGVLALAFLIFAGFKFIVGSGNADTATKSRTMITYIIAGIVVIISAYPIVNTFLTLGTENRDNIRVEFRMGSSILLGADLNRNDCIYSGSVSGLVRMCYEEDLLVIKNPIVNTFYQVPEVLGKCQEFLVFSICVSRAQTLDDL